jgi:hypothetical protein
MIVSSNVLDIKGENFKLIGAHPNTVKGLGLGEWQGEAKLEDYY